MPSVYNENRHEGGKRPKKVNAITTFISLFFFGEHASHYGLMNHEQFSRMKAGRNIQNIQTSHHVPTGRHSRRRQWCPFFNYCKCGGDVNLGLSLSFSAPPSNARAFTCHSPSCDHGGLVRTTGPPRRSPCLHYMYLYPPIVSRD